MRLMQPQVQHNMLKKNTVKKTIKLVKIEVSFPTRLSV